MGMIANSSVALVALLHIYFLVLEMFLWTKPRGLRTFGLTPEFAEASKNLAANQGLYNGFLAAGLLSRRDTAAGRCGGFSRRPAGTSSSSFSWAVSLSPGFSAG